VTFCVRAMAAQDLDSVLVMAAESVEAPHWNRRDYEQILLAAPSDPIRRCGLVAESGGKLVGFAVARWVRPETTADVEGLFVQPEYRRQGIGNSLLGACKAWAAEAGASTVRLEVRASNTAAHALYRRHGFSPAGVRRAYYSAPVEDALLLHAPLLPLTPLPL
jgi:[ribosomal protein S18]-alanine N-acetyltransferase